MVLESKIRYGVFMQKTAKLAICYLTLVSCLLLSMALNIPAQAQVTETPALFDPLSLIEQKRNETNEALEELSSQANSHALLLEKLQMQIALYKSDQLALRTLLDETLTNKRELDQKIAQSAERLSTLEGDSAEIALSLNERRGVLAEVLAAIQRLGSNPPPALLVQPEDALSSVRSAMLLGAVVPELRGEVTVLLSDLADLAEIRSQIIDERETLKLALTDIVTEEEKLGQLLQEKAALNLVSLQQLERERQKASALSLKGEQLATVIQSLDDEIDAINEERAAARRAEQERQKRAKERIQIARRLAEQSEDNLTNLSPLYAFAILKDTLRLPIEGAIEARFGDQTPSGGPLDGILLSSQSDASVKSPIDGTIVFSGPFRSYGNVIIIDAGDGYHLILAGMDRLNVRQGQFVVSGEPIAQMGSVTIKSAQNETLALASGKPTLYIELRKDKKIIDSTPWWGALRWIAPESGKARNDT